LRKFRAAADFFDDEFGIRLAVEGVHPWTPEEPVTSTSDLLKLLKAQVRLTDGRESFDLIIGFTQLPGRVMPGHARVDEIGDCATGLGNYIALAIADTSGHIDDGRLRGDTDVQSLIHEIGHIFGAEHVEDRESIMAVYFRPYSDFDKKNRDIISQNKFCAFRRG
jgi:metallopeptidase family M12-like protein